MVYPFDKYITLFLESSVSTFTCIEWLRKSNIIYQSFFVKTCLHYQAIKISYIFHRLHVYMFTWPGYNYQIYITSINLLFNNKVFRKTYINDQAVITFFFHYLCFDILQIITDYYLLSMFVTYWDKSKTDILLVSL